MKEAFLNFLKEAGGVGESDMESHLIANFPFPENNQYIFELFEFLIELDELETRLGESVAPGTVGPAVSAEDVLLHRYKTALFKVILLHIRGVFVEISWSDTEDFVSGLVYASRAERDGVHSNQLVMTIGQIVKLINLMTKVSEYDFAKRTYSDGMLQILNCFHAVIFKYNAFLKSDLSHTFKSALSCSQEVAEDIDAVLRQNMTPEILKIMWEKFSDFHTEFSLACRDG